MMVPKFRAWDKKTKEYFHISELWNSGINSECFNFDGWTDNFGNKGRLKDIVIEQSTGLKDANGKEIYEGDILAWHSNVYRKQDWVGLVQYRGAGFVVQDDPKEFSTSTWLEVACSKDANIVEIVGNIHENPELLEES